MLDVISSLDPSCIDDLFSFQLFVHYRAFRKLAWRVLEFSRHWGQVPFEILFDHLDKDLASENFTFKYQDPIFHHTIQSYLAQATEDDVHTSSSPSSNPVYCVDAENAPQWVNALIGLWNRLEVCLLNITTTAGTDKKTARMTSPNAKTVEQIVTLMYMFEALLPVFKHLLSAKGVAGALEAAGKLQSPSRLFSFVLMLFPEEAYYNSRTGNQGEFADSEEDEAEELDEISVSINDGES